MRCEDFTSEMTIPGQLHAISRFALPKFKKLYFTCDKVYQLWQLMSRLTRSVGFITSVDWGHQRALGLPGRDRIRPDGNEIQVHEDLERLFDSKEWESPTFMHLQMRRNPKPISASASPPNNQ